MKRPFQIVLLLIAALVFSGPGLAAKSGKSRTVTQPPKGSPEALIASAIVAAHDKDEKKGDETNNKVESDSAMEKIKETKGKMHNGKQRRETSDEKEESTSARRKPTSKKGVDDH